MVVPFVFRPVSRLELEERLQRIEFLREIITSTIL